MLDSIVKFDLAVFAFMCLAGCAMHWLTPLGTYPHGRRGRYLLPVAALVCLLLLFVPLTSASPTTLARVYVVAALTPVYLWCAVAVSRALVNVVRERMQQEQDGRPHERERERERTPVDRDRHKARGG